ncbi:ankyrin repeat-containing domain protein [Mycena rebaudengoi]|nr:ankyrin repeat-containing domain protein [Mycena rebaudengoi]
MQQTQGGIAHNVADTHHEVLKFITDTEREKIIDWLSPANFFLQQETIFGRRQVGTGEWLLADDRFKQWKTGSGGILWGRGAPGAGKTVLASIIVDHLVESHADDNVGVACIYLNHKEIHAQTTSNLLAGVWRQLVLGKPIASTSLVHKLFQKHSEKHTKPELAQIHEVVRLAIVEWSRVYIIVDALDETPEDNQQCLLDYLTDMGPTVCLMLTSRHDVSLPNITAETFEICVPEEDIQKYVEHQINKSRQLSLHVGTSLQLREEIITKILENADRMFLLAKLHIESLAGCTTIATIRERLEKLSSNLELAYSQAMERIDIQTEERKRLAYSTLTWVTTAMQPLEVTELQEALAVEWGAKSLNPEKRPKMEIILSVCVGLVIVDIDEESSMVRLIHATTQEYFDGRFPGAHTEITCTLLTYMLFDELHMVFDKPLQVISYEESDYEESKITCWENVRQPERQLRELIMDVLEQAVAWHSFWRDYWVPCPWDYPSWPKAPSPLWVAAAANLHGIVQYLLDGGVSPDSGQTQDDSPLCTASFYGHLQIAVLLLEAGANVNVDGGPTCSALEAASGGGHIDMVCLLLEKGADIQAGDDGALWRASMGGHTEVVQALLRKGANANVTNENGESLLIAMSAEEYTQPEQHVNIARLLLENGADIHARNNSVLQAASKRGYTEVVQLLLEHGANINTVDEHNGGALEAAASWDGSPDLADAWDLEDGKRRGLAEARLTHVHFLLDNGADVHAGNNGALRAASKRGYTEVVQLLLEHGANINAADKHTGSALEAAASWDGSPSIDYYGDSEDEKRTKLAEAATRRLTHVRFLLNNSADVHVRNNGALREAAKAGYTEVVQLLVENGANVNAADEHTASALEAAASWDGSVYIEDLEDGKRRRLAEARLTHVRFLLDNGADVHAGNNGALRAASKRGYTEVVQLLLEHGANINAADEHTGSALEAAASWDGSPFIDYGDSEDEKRTKMAEATARRLPHIPSRRGYTEVVQLLLEHGADVNAANKHTGSALEAAASWDGNPSINSWDSKKRKRRKMADAAARRLMRVHFLLDNGADVHGGNNGALRAASKWGYTEVVQLLLEYGADALENAETESQNAELESQVETDSSEADSDTEPLEADSDPESSEADSDPESSEADSDTESSEADTETESSEADTETDSSEAESQNAQTDSSEVESQYTETDSSEAESQNAEAENL